MTTPVYELPKISNPPTTTAKTSDKPVAEEHDPSESTATLAEPPNIDSETASTAIGLPKPNQSTTAATEISSALHKEKQMLSVSTAKATELQKTGNGGRPPPPPPAHRRGGEASGGGEG
jgi:hypothetical protein